MAEVFLANRMLAISCIGVCTCVCRRGEGYSTAYLNHRLACYQPTLVNSSKTIAPSSRSL